MDAEGGELREVLVKSYLPLLGRELLALAWMPIGSDTPDVVARLRSPVFAFSGGALLAFKDAPELFLTWGQHHPYRLEATTETVAWSPFSLDRVHASRESPWDQVEGGRLLAVELFTGPGACGGVVGSRHRLTSPMGNTFVWIATGYDDGVREGDDLWVSIGVEPPNLDALAPVMTLEA